LEKTDLDLVQTEGRVILRVWRLLDDNFSLLAVILRIPFRLNQVQRGLFKPHFSPLDKRKLSDREFFLHFCQEIINGGITPCILMEVS